MIKLLLFLSKIFNSNKAPDLAKGGIVDKPTLATISRVSEPVWPPEIYLSDKHKAILKQLAVDDNQEVTLEKTWVECEDCKKVLPIKRVTIDNRKK